MERVMPFQPDLVDLAVLTTLEVDYAWIPGAIAAQASRAAAEAAAATAAAAAYAAPAGGNGA